MEKIIRGEVVGGNKIGRRLGFPTANIRVDESLAAATGVYRARVEAAGRTWDAVVNLGRKPSVAGSGARVLEANLIGFEGDLYGQTIAVELLEFIRPERRFDSFEALRSQIALDRETVMKKL